MLCENTTSKLLGMEDVIVKKVWEEWDRRHIEVEQPRRMHICPACGRETDTIHDYREQRVRDIPSYGKYTPCCICARDDTDADTAGNDSPKRTPFCRVTIRRRHGWWPR